MIRIENLGYQFRILDCNRESTIPIEYVGSQFGFLDPNLGSSIPFKRVKIFGLPDSCSETQAAVNVSKDSACHRQVQRFSPPEPLSAILLSVDVFINSFAVDVFRVPTAVDVCIYLACHRTNLN